MVKPLNRQRHIYAIQRFAARESYPSPLPSYAVTRIGSGPARIAKWCDTWEAAEEWIATRGYMRFPGGDSKGLPELIDQLPG